jgi:hypothetical protein
MFPLICFIFLFADVTSQYFITDVEFDNTVAEWLRFAKQRDRRDRKKMKMRIILQIKSVN